MKRPTLSYSFTGTFFMCMSLLAFEIFCARLLAVVVGPYLVLYILALAMLGMSAAASMMSLFDWPPRNTPKNGTLSWLCLLLGASYLGALLQMTAANGSSNELLSRAIDAGGLDALVEASRITFISIVGVTGVILAIPYFIFGIVIAALFRSAPADLYDKLYFTDLAGAATGCVVCVVALETFGYEGMFLIVPLAAFFAAGAFAWTHGSKVLLVLPIVGSALTIYVASSPPLLSHFEPAPELSKLARNYDKTYDVVQQWRIWNSHSRVARITLTANDRSLVRDIYAQADGAGWANATYNPLDSVFQAAITMALEPRKVLVLFAGVGYDMRHIDDLCRDECDITGVEINKQMVAHAVKQDPGLAAFLAKPNISLEIAEAREFLEGDRNNYDAILLAWSGAGFSYYMGTAGALAQYLYTREALESLLEHLSPSGVLIIADGSKARFLYMLRQIFDERKYGAYSESVIAFKQDKTPALISTSSRFDLLDKIRLVVKPDGLSDAETVKVVAAGVRSGYRLIISPSDTDPAYQIYRDLIAAPDVENVVDELARTRDIDLSVVTDDRPFFINMTPRHHYLSAARLLATPDGSASPQWKVAVWLFRMFVGLAVVAILLIVGPLLLNKGPKLTWVNVGHMVYFVCVGIGFMLIEVGMVRKLGLLMGNPAYSIAIVLATIIFATGVGARFSTRVFAAGVLDFRRSVVGIIVYTLILAMGIDSLIALALPWGIVAKAVLVMVILFPLGFLMGQLFPQGLVKVEAQDGHLVPWAWALNGAASTIAVGLGIFLSYPLGFSAIIYAGAACYALILLLPNYRSANLAR
jgi:hypothetical protein